MVVVPWVLPSSAAARGSRPLFARLCGWVAEGLPSTTASVQTGVGPLARQQRAQGMEGRALCALTHGNTDVTSVCWTTGRVGNWSSCCFLSPFKKGSLSQVPLPVVDPRGWFERVTSYLQTPTFPRAALRLGRRAELRL